jgi:hypothetical protein
MKNLKRLGVSVTLMCVLACAALAGETNAPPCAAPGETNAPPCAAAQLTPDDAIVPAETSSPPASNAGDASSVTEFALDLLQSVLLIF